MERYRLVIYWLDGGGAEQLGAGGEYSFEASDDSSAIRLAHELFHEQINMADQCAVVKESGQTVWQNEPLAPAPGSDD